MAGDSWCSTCGRSTPGTSMCVTCASWRWKENPPPISSAEQAHERAFRAMREALERVAEDAIQDDAVDDRVILPDETLTIVERALALAQEVEEDA